VLPTGIRPVEAAGIISRGLADGPGWLDPPSVSELLDCYGLPLIATRFPPDADGAVATPPAGVELIIGVVNDHSFGPVLACGAGGTTAELINDVAVRITPISDDDARQMLRSLRTFPLLDGYRGAPRCDVDAVEEILLRVGAMVEQHPEIVELDCNPVIVGPDGAVIVDARVRVQTAPLPRPMASLRA
jgi:acyl-CoA synthetase (NDP forming)